MSFSKRSSSPAGAELLLQSSDFLDPFAVGAWSPNVDICQAENRIVVRAELPGVPSSDLRVTFEGDSLRIQGVKREPEQSRKLLCYYCLERRYGRFDRKVRIDWVVNPRLARARLEHGILTVELPRLEDRRGHAVLISVKGK